MFMLAALRPVFVFLAEAPKLCMTAACEPIQRLRLLIQRRMQLSKDCRALVLSKPPSWFGDTNTSGNCTARAPAAPGPVANLGNP